MAAEPAGNRWFKVNLHVHGEKNDPAEVVARAREAEIDLLAITDHQSFDYCDGIISAATASGRPLTVLPGIEITSHEGVHALAIFPKSYGTLERTRLLGWLEITGGGDTRVASSRNLADIFEKVRTDDGIIIVPHPFTQGIGMLDSARKLSTKVEWLESGHVGLMQVSDDKIQYVAWDDQGNWVNRFVLASASSGQIQISNYCLAPFNRSDAHKPSEISDGCSWFRMGEPTVEGLRQVACEPKTRIARVQPTIVANNAVLAMRITGGYSDGQFFRFNAGLNCVIGQNYAGKSAVFDFTRFALGMEESVDSEMRLRLLTRLNGILGVGGVVELFVRSDGELYSVKRTFNPQVSGVAPNFQVQSCPERAVVYRFDAATDSLIPTKDFKFAVEVYEQGKISRLRDDVARQLEMLDEFAGVAELKKQRAQIVSELALSAEALVPLYEEREQLKGEVAVLATLKQELETKEKLLPGSEEQKWAKASAFVSEIETVQDELNEALLNIPTEPAVFGRESDLERLFGQSVPDLAADEIVRADLLQPLRAHAQSALTKLNAARDQIATAIQTFANECKPLRNAWQDAYAEHQRELSETLRKAGVESPQELIARVSALRQQIATIENQKQPRLSATNTSIDNKEAAREKLLAELDATDAALSAKRVAKARELTDALDGKIKIEVKPLADRTKYLQTLTELCGQLATRDSQIKNRDAQLGLVVNALTPQQLARALRNKGNYPLSGEATLSLADFCGITTNTQNFLCRIADNVRLLTKLQTLSTPDVPQILVQRRGETAFADLRIGLSPGEQSAAILTLALQTRAMPLIIDQPEDELGYSYVVHLIVPKILEAKFARQILIITHNANIPVLGDADYVLKMENRPRADSGRTCAPAVVGCFESASVTKALVELEGGQRAFDFRRFRYAMPKSVA